MTPADVARVALRLGDALLAIAEEMRRPDACAAILEADRLVARDLVLVLARERGRYEWPVASLLACGEPASADLTEERGEAWKNWGAWLSMREAA